MNLDRNGLEVLERDESVELLRNAVIGRVLVTVGALPSAFPVNYALLGDDVVFRTGAGTKLTAAARDAVVAFQVDDFDAQGHGGWSVLVTGHATEIEAPEELEAAVRLPLQSWLPEQPDRFIRIQSQLVTGRRLSLDARAAHRATAARAAVAEHREAERPPWSGPAVDACRACGCDRLLPVSDGDQTNFVCADCAACRHVEQGWMYRVHPATCPGCAFKEQCSRSFLAEALRLEGTVR